MAPDDEATSTEIERFVRQLGPINLTAEQMQELAKAGESLRDLSSSLPRDFAIADEPAHVFRPREEA